MTNRIVATVFPFAVLLADAGANVMDKWSPLVNLGAVGCILAWFILQATPLMKSLVAAIDRNTRASMLAVISMHGVPPNVRDQAADILREIEHK